ncbi:nitroreductase family protein [Pseudodesulfovibrio sp. zrk46]|uniref:nitroreductase family protein n=1 Tax=Pseudodesulfovibrio sp. zrk46 TaxID=2725288 RepID=UPI001448C520|nr:nitroreductase family protein [Pseudodesulfovibrio sp. zrk46]QJB57867.1 nitroreductase family protein [Pseudodesulfovibrio sp. zrk46]
MDFKELVARSRSRRKFDQSVKINVNDLIDLVDTVRLIPSGMNIQPLKYVVVADEDLCSEIFPHLGWAGYLKDWKGPDEGERPAGYIIVLLDKDISENPYIDHGIASQTIMLAAAEKGLGGCMIATVNRKKVMQVIGIGEQYEVLLVLALGVPTEEVTVEPLPSDGKIEYWRTSDGKHHVPKRSLDDLIVGLFPKKEDCDN